MIIAIPSKNRYENTTTQNVFKDGVFFVPENEVQEYQKRIQNKIVGVPAKYNGITKTRNWILKQHHNQNVLFIDDDVREVGTFQEGKRINLKDKTGGDIIQEEFKKLFDITNGIGFKIFGVEAGGSKFANHPLSPIAFKGIINGSCMGIINDGSFYFDEQFEVKEDYDIVLRHFKKHGGVLKARYFYIRTYHWENAGGCVDYRTDKMEDDAIELLQKRFPLMIRTGQRKNKHQILVSWD